MKKMVLLVISLIATFVITGCSSSEPKTPQIKFTKQLKLEKVDFNFRQKHNADIQYHSKEELEKLFKEGILNNLKEKNILTKNSNADSVKIVANYTRHHMGELTPFPSDSLAYPSYSFTLEIARGNKVLKRINKSNLKFNGGLAMNLQVIAGGLRDKKYEIDFINAFVNTIVNDIEDLERK